MRSDAQNIFTLLCLKKQNNRQAAKVTDDQARIRQRLAPLQLTASIVNDIAICEIAPVGE